MAASAVALPHLAHRTSVFLFPCPWDRGDGNACDGDVDASVDVLVLNEKDWARAEELGYREVVRRGEWALLRRPQRSTR